MSERMKIFEYFDKYRDFTDERVKDGIEKYRKGNLKINVTDADGKPVKNAKISSNGTGYAETRGFYGDYDIEITADGKCANGKIKFSKNGGNEFSFSI